jgi:hypothetical protein
MATYQDREAFIPYRRTELVELCLADGKLEPAEAQQFREFCEILAAYYHFEFHRLQEHLKDNFAPFNPDSESRANATFSAAELEAMEQQVVETLETVLKRANYKALSAENLTQAFTDKSLVDLRTEVDFDDFDQMLFYYRGDTQQTVAIKKLFRMIPLEINVLERVVVLLKFKEAAYFEAKKVELKTLSFEPGKMYIYLYKNIPKNDLELIFPNVKVSMTWKDRLLFGVPAIGAAIPLMLRALPQILLIIGVILFFTMGPAVAAEWGADETRIKNFMPVLAALLSLVVALGGFAVKQYNSYKTKQMKFLKNVTDTLFFRNLSSNAGVLQSLIDTAEEEECKEIILVYYHLLTQPGALTAAQLDDKIESWMEQKLGAKIDFDINGPLRNLEKLRGKILTVYQDEAGTPEKALLTRDAQGVCHLLSLEESKRLIDYIWDNAFRYASTPVVLKQ